MGGGYTEGNKIKFEHANWSRACTYYVEYGNVVLRGIVTFSNLRRERDRYTHTEYINY